MEAVISEPVSVGIPCIAGKYREILAFDVGARPYGRRVVNKFKVFPPNSLRIGTGIFRGAEKRELCLA